MRLRLLILPVLLAIFLASMEVQAADKEAENKIRGTIFGQVAMAAGAGSASGMVAFFNVDNGPPPKPGVVKRVPDHIAALSPEARFSAEVRPGRYYVGVIFGRSSRQVGPPKAGESTMVAHGEDGKPQVFSIKANENIDIGLISGKVPEDLGRTTGSFTIKGTVKDKKGTPMSGAIVLAFRVGEKTGRPSYTLNGTEADGSYELQLAADIDYHITVRTKYGGGQPEPGEFVGRHGDKEAIAVNGRAGDLVSDVDIEVFLVPEPGESKSKFEKKPQEPPLEKTLQEHFFDTQGGKSE